MPALLEAKGLHAAYGETRVLHGIDFMVEEGGVTALLGANGAGKTTTLRAICGMVKTQGEVLLAGQRILVVVRGLAMAGRGEGLVHGDLHAGDLAAVEAPEREGIARVVGDAEDLGDAELLCLLLRRVEDGMRLAERQGLVGVHV